MNKPQTTPLAREVERLRAGCGWSLARLAQESGVKLSTIKAIVQGASRHPRHDSAQKLAAAFGISVDALLGIPPGAAERGGGRRGAISVATAEQLWSSAQFAYVKADYEGAARYGRAFVARMDAMAKQAAKEASGDGVQANNDVGVAEVPKHSPKRRGATAAG